MNQITDNEKYDANREVIEFWLTRDEWELYMAACIFSDIEPSPHLEKVLTGRNQSKLRFYKNLKGEFFDSNSNVKGSNYSIEDLHKKEIEIRDNLIFLGRVNVYMNPDSRWVAKKENFMEIAFQKWKKIPWHQWALKNKLMGKFSKTPIKESKTANFKAPHISELKSVIEYQKINNLYKGTELKADSRSYPIELGFAIKAWEAVINSKAKGKPKALIRKWLDENTNLSNEAKERISIVANWDKTGGATRTIGD